jgi:DNA recombination protein RmuC
MQDLLSKIQNDPTLMFISVIALVVLLIIALVVVVSSMRVKIYKDRFINVREDNNDKAERILSLEKELQEYKIKNASNEQELQHFSETKDVLNSTKEFLSTTQKEFTELEKEQNKLTTKLENIQAMYDNLLDEHKTLEERTEHMLEENSKIRINNARLLVKLETGEMFASQLKQRVSKKNPTEEE